MKSVQRLEQTYLPEAAILISDPNYENEQQILVSNSGFKFKTFSLVSQLCRQTILGPTFGGQINRMKSFTKNGAQYIAYSTQSHVLGVSKLPLDGNPFRSMGMIGFSGNVKIYHTVLVNQWL